MGKKDQVKSIVFSQTEKKNKIFLIEYKREIDKKYSILSFIIFDTYIYRYFEFQFFINFHQSEFIRQILIMLTKK